MLLFISLVALQLREMNIMITHVNVSIVCYFSLYNILYVLFTQHNELANDDHAVIQCLLRIAYAEASNSQYFNFPFRFDEY